MLRNGVADGLLRGHSIHSSIKTWVVGAGAGQASPAPVKPTYLLVHAGEPQPGEPADWYTHTDGGFLYESEHAGNPVAVFENPDHAKRIVACLNACKGFSTEQLEDRRFIEPVDSAGEGASPGVAADLAAALQLTLDGLKGWMEIQDEEDARESDDDAVAAAEAALLAFHGGQLPDADGGEESPQLPTWTVWVVEKNRSHGTTFVTSCEAGSPEEAGEIALAEAAESFNEDADTLRVLGVAAGEVNLVIWDDDN